MNKLLLQTFGTFIGGALLLGLLLFLPAGTFDFWQAWVFILVFMVTISIFGYYFSVKDPELIERRKQAGPGAEQTTVQKIVATLAFSLLFAIFILCGLDRRFGWSHMPPLVSIIGDAVEVFSFYVFTVVFKANSFGAGNIRVEEKQKVSSSGPYGIVRHPMYVGTIFMTIGVALGLGSWWILLILPIQLAILAVRILNEEKVLENELEGYKEYEQKVRYRLAPHVW